MSGSQDSLSGKQPLAQVIDHLRCLATETTQVRADVGRRRELIDGYFAAAPEIMAGALEPQVVSIEDRQAYWFVPEGADTRRRLLYIHGGSWMSGSVVGYAALCSRLARASGCALLFIDYALMPEHPFPEGLNNCVAAYHWMSDNGPDGDSPAVRTYIVGDSAGGNLTLASLLSLKQKGAPLPDAVIAMSPCTDFTGSGESMQTRREADPIILPEAIPLLAQMYLQNGDCPTQPLVSPLFGELSGLPPLLLQTGDAEVLLDDTLRFAEKAEAAGVDVTLDVWPEMIHVFQGFAPLLPQAVEAIGRMADFIRSH